MIWIDARILCNRWASVANFLCGRLTRLLQVSFWEQVSNRLRAVLVFDSGHCTTIGGLNPKFGIHFSLFLSLKPATGSTAALLPLHRLLAMTPKTTVFVLDYTRWVKTGERSLVYISTAWSIQNLPLLLQLWQIGSFLGLEGRPRCLSVRPSRRPYVRKCVLAYVRTCVRTSVRPQSFFDDSNEIFACTGWKSPFSPTVFWL